MVETISDEARAGLDSPHAWDALTSEVILADVTGPDALMVLTDEEILAIDGWNSPGVVALPWADQQETGRDVLAAVAARSLIARGHLVTAADARKHTNLPEAVLQNRDLILSETVNGITVLRKIASGLVSFHRVVAAPDGTQQMHHLYYYLQRDGLALEEEVTHNGMHHFTVLRVAEDARDRVRRFVDPQGAAAVDTEPQELDLAQVAEDSPLGTILLDARAVTSGNSVATGSDSSKGLVFYTASEHVVLSQPLAGQADGPSLVREVASESLLQAIDFLFAPED